MTAKEYQAELQLNLISLFPNQEIRSEWAAFTGLKYQYSPRVDLAIGPFNISPGANLIDTYNSLVQESQFNNFLTTAFQYHVVNLDLSLYDEILHPNFEQLIFKNQNSRCLIAIEIENLNSKKHIMGSIVNASSLGRVGIGIACNLTTLNTFCRILNYLSFLKRVDKNTYDVTNFIVLTIAQVQHLLNNHLENG